MHDCGSQEDLVAWAEIPWSSCDSENSSRMRLLPPDHQTYRPTRLLKVSVLIKKSRTWIFLNFLSVFSYRESFFRVNAPKNITITHVSPKEVEEKNHETKVYFLCYTKFLQVLIYLVLILNYACRDIQLKSRIH